MLSEEEFTKRFVARLMEIFQDNKLQQWMKDISPDSYEMWIGDDPEASTPEDMADEEADAMRELG